MVALSYPGVYVHEVPSGVRSVPGVATSITAFVGRARRGPVNKAVRIANFGDYERQFGGLWAESTMSYAVYHFFLNGGTDAYIVRAINGGESSAGGDSEGDAALSLSAANPGAWGDRLSVSVDHDTIDQGEPGAALFNLTIQELNDDGEASRAELFRNLSTEPSDPRFVQAIVNDGSALVQVVDVGTTRPLDAATIELTGGDDGEALTNDQVTSTDGGAIYALKHVDIFNILCIPPYLRQSDPGNVDVEMTAAYKAALGFLDSEKRRAILLQDPLKAWTSVEDVETNLGDFDRHKNAAFFFPNVVAPDPELDNRMEEFAPCGAMAGILARTDATRGVWKAAAGIDASIRGSSGLALPLTDAENGQLNPLGVNCLRSFPVIGRVVWGSRTLYGADILASEWKYLPVRRLALFLEESLFRGTQWVVFEPNDEALWGQIRLNLGAFMQNLFRQGAFQGTSPAEAYFVKCDKETTTQNDIDLGIVNIVIGFAPLKPAEFVVLKFQQIAGQIAA